MKTLKTIINVVLYVINLFLPTESKQSRILNEIKKIVDIVFEENKEMLTCFTDKEKDQLKQINYDIAFYTKRLNRAISEGDKKRYKQHIASTKSSLAFFKALDKQRIAKRVTNICEEKL